MRHWIILGLVVWGVVSTFPAWAVLELLSPVGDERVPLVAEAQKRVMGLATLEERIALLQADRAADKKLAHDPNWRKPLPLVLKLRGTEQEKGPWKVRIGKKPDLSDARDWYLSTAKADQSTGREGKSDGDSADMRVIVPMANLEVATRYYWQVSWRERCGFSCRPNHDCGHCTRTAVSQIASFVTEDVAPRWIAVEGRVSNFRDFGGRIGLDGRRVRQGMAYRGQGLNDNSVTGETRGRNRLTVEDVRYLRQVLGIRTDLDLRTIGETADLKYSPLGEGVKFIRRSSACYQGIFKPEGMKTMAMNFRELCDEANYPIYFHCIGGADRTGALAYVMNGVLGVSRHDAETDWESTFYPRIPDEDKDPNYWCRESHFNAGLAKYGTTETSWNERVVLYLKDCGVTDAEIAAFREIMLEK